MTALDWPAPPPALRYARVFANRGDEARSRRASDVILVVVALIGLCLLGALAAPQPAVQRAFMGFVADIPHSLWPFWQAMVGLLSAFVLVLVVIVAVRRRWAVLRDIVLAGLLALGGAVLLGRVAVGTWPAVWDSLRAAGDTPYFPPLSIAVPSAISIAGSPYLTRPGRRLGRWLVLLAAVGAVLKGVATPSGTLAAVLVGAAAAAAVHLLFGSSLGRPSLDDVALGLTGVGVRAHSLEIAERQPAGVFNVDAQDEAGQPLLVKLYGRDAHDTQLLTTIWHTVWYREAGSPTSFGRLQQAEHEAFLTLLAGQSGIPTETVVTARGTPTSDVLLVLRRLGPTLRERSNVWSAATARDCWALLADLHRTAIAHGQVDDEHLVVTDDRIGLIDFRGAALSVRPERFRTDRAQLLVSTALALGIPDALDIAHTALGNDGLADVLPLVQLPALTGRLRHQLREKDLDLDDLRDQAAVKVGQQAPELLKMRRVTVGSVVQIVLLGLAFWALASLVANLDFATLASEIRNATWWLVIVGALVAQAPRLTNAVSVMGASPAPLPLGPVYALQLAISYIALAIPASAARVAVNIRFFQRHGLPAGTALGIGVLDSLGQFSAQVLLLVGILLFSSFSLDLDLSGAVPSGLGKLLLIIVIAVVVSLVLLVSVPKWRRFVFGWVRRLLSDALAAVRGLQSPRRLTMLLGANLASEVLFAFSLQLFVLALGYHAGLAELILMNVAISLLSGVLPIPGGIGVVEGGLTYGLVLAGLPEETAFAAVLLYRIASFYLPPVWGFFALRWLERNKHL
jgi:glycosyltransferase 2 family protein